MIASSSSVETVSGGVSFSLRMPSSRAGLDLSANIDFRSRIVSDQHHGQSGPSAQSIDTRRQLRHDLITHDGSVENLQHATASLTSGRRRC